MAKTDALIVALDVEDFQEARQVVRRLGSAVKFYKVGLRLFTREGPAVVQWLKSKGLKVFLDLKFHDIPNTVAQAIESATRLKVDLITVHALGGEEMMRAAVSSAKRASRKLGKARPKIFAVTILTSQNNLKPLGMNSSVLKQVYRLAQLAHRSGVDGLVCSPHEVKDLKKKYGTRLHFITPGLRLDPSSAGDQKRIATPSQAFRDGADHLVVGRPILKSPDPQGFAKIILKGLKR